MKKPVLKKNWKITIPESLRLDNPDEIIKKVDSFLTTAVTALGIEGIRGYDISVEKILSENFPFIFSCEYIHGDDNEEGIYYITIISKI